MCAFCEGSSTVKEFNKPHFYRSLCTVADQRPADRNYNLHRIRLIQNCICIHYVVWKANHMNECKHDLPFIFSFFLDF